MMVDRPQPLLGPHEEGQRRHDHERRGVIEAAEPGADQSHVVIERQPAHEHVRRACIHRRAHGADVRQQIGMAQHHALRIAGAARGVLNKSRAAGLHRRRCASGCLAQRLNADHVAQALDLKLDESRQRSCRGRGDEQRRARVAKDAGLPIEMLLELRRARRRIDRNRHAAGIEHAEKRREEVDARRQHDRDPLAGLETGPRQAMRHGSRLFREPPVGEARLLPVTLPKHDMDPLAVLAYVPVEHFRESLGVGRRRAGRAFGEFRPAGELHGRPRRARPQVPAANPRASPPRPTDDRAGARKRRARS